MSHHRYPARGLVPDYARAGAGFALTGGPLLAVPADPIVAYALAGMAALFLLFGVRTALRHVTVVELSPEGIRSSGPLAAALPWSGLSSVRLSYYATRRDRAKGWMQLRLAGSGGRLSVDSAIDGFPAIAAAAYEAARRNRVRLSDITATNLLALGVAVETEPAAP
jgi:hypothetical protein